MSELPVKKSRIEKELNEEFLKTEEVKIPGTPRERGEEGLRHKREAVELLRDVMSYQSDDLSRYRLASALGGLAFNLVLNSQFAEARAQCEEAQSLVNKIGDGIKKEDRDNLVFIQGNLAHVCFSRATMTKHSAFTGKTGTNRCMEKRLAKSLLRISPHSTKPASPIAIYLG
jgi:hypothetical protein